MENKYLSILKKIQTPYKLPQLVLKPSYQKGNFDSHAVDAPFVFACNGKFYMTYVGWDTIGYQTGLAFSSDLSRWHKKGIILSRGPKDSPTEFNIALTWILRDNELFGKGELKQIDGNFIGTYHVYPSSGYEEGPANIGFCFSKDLLHWEVAKPTFHHRGGRAWESGGLYKSCLIEHNGTYFMFYNAKDRDEGPWLEQIGVATSKDLKNWLRHPDNPVLPVGIPGSFDDYFASDPCVLKCGNIWVMFYYARCRSDGRARDSAAFSEDLIHWEKSDQLLIDVGQEGSIDSLYAHKPSIFFHKGKLYHYYCAVSKAANRHLGEIEHDEIRGIALATSKKIPL